MSPLVVYIAEKGLEQLGVPLDLWIQAAEVVKVEWNQKVHVDMARHKW